MSDELMRERARYEALAALVDNYRRERDEARRLLELAHLGRAQLEGWRDGLERERDEARAEAASSLAMARIADEKYDMKCAEADVLRGVGCMEDGDGPCGVCRECFYRHGYRRGAEAMREACIGTACAQDLDPDAQDRMEEQLRALPIPEEP